jgi:hypothetical protein
MKLMVVDSLCIDKNGSRIFVVGKREGFMGFQDAFGCAEYCGTTWVKGWNKEVFEFSEHDGRERSPGAQSLLCLAWLFFKFRQCAR